MVFGTTELTSKKPDTAAQKVLGDKMRESWTSFAKDPEHGLEKIGWPLYNVNLPTIIRLGKANSSSIEFIHPQVYDGNCRIYDELGEAGVIAALTGGKGKGKGNGVSA